MRSHWKLWVTGIALVQLLVIGVDVALLWPLPGRRNRRPNWSRWVWHFRRRRRRNYSAPIGKEGSLAAQGARITQNVAIQGRLPIGHQHQGDLEPAIHGVYRPGSSNDSAPARPPLDPLVPHLGPARAALGE